MSTGPEVQPRRRTEARERRVFEPLLAISTVIAAMAILVAAVRL